MAAHVIRSVTPTKITIAPGETTLTVPLLVGMDAPHGGEFRTATDLYPGMRYTRDFGVDGTDADTLPELTAHGTGKLADMPAGCIPHVSWKDDVGQLTSWLDGLNQSVYLTWYHEPMGDVTPAAYRAAASQITQILDGHPNRSMVLGHGPIVTRYWLDEGRGNPTDWGYPGMTHYGVDCYQNTPSSSTYWPVSKMFEIAFGKVRAAYPGIRLWVPEYGITKLTTDSTGTGRAQTIRDHVAWLRGQDDVDAIAYYNNAAKFPQYALTDPPSQQAWRDMQAAA